MVKFNVTGTMKLGSEERRFQREFDAPSEKRAREIAYSFFGSKHGLKRSNLVIESVEPARSKA